MVLSNKVHLKKSYFNTKQNKSIICTVIDGAITKFAQLIEPSSFLTE